MSKLSHDKIFEVTKEPSLNFWLTLWWGIVTISIFGFEVYEFISFFEINSNSGHLLVAGDARTFYRDSVDPNREISELVKFFGFDLLVSYVIFLFGDYELAYLTVLAVFCYLSLNLFDKAQPQLLIFFLLTVWVFISPFSITKDIFVLSALLAVGNFYLTGKVRFALAALLLALVAKTAALILIFLLLVKPLLNMKPLKLLIIGLLFGSLFTPIIIFFGFAPRYFFSSETFIGGFIFEMKSVGFYFLACWLVFAGHLMEAFNALIVRGDVLTFLKAILALAFVCAALLSKSRFVINGTILYFFYATQSSTFHFRYLEPLIAFIIVMWSVSAQSKMRPLCCESQN